MNEANFKKKLMLKIQGGQAPNGTVKVSGAKNAATKLMAAAMLTSDIVTLYNFPTELIDVRYKADFMSKIGVNLSFDDISSVVTINSNNICIPNLDNYEYPIRTTYLLVAAQLNKNGLARIPYPGGCRIGDRKYDLHVMIWEKMGCKVSEKNDYIEINGQLKPAEICFPMATIGGTENALICAAGIDGTTFIRNAYVSPEVYCLIEFLRSIGADISTAGNSFISVTGCKKLRGSSFKIIPDRIEALTWIIFGVLSQGKIIVENVPFDIMEAPLLHLKEAGIDIFQNSTDVYVNNNCLKNKKIQPFEIACGTYPGVISDMQPFYTILGLKAHGISRIYDYRYPDRTSYLSELEKFCPDALKWESGKITINGPSKFIPANAVSTDLRGSMSLVMAALLADGNSTIIDVELALRGYNRLLEKLQGLELRCKIDYC
ncbi:UDP-N-acetylglucosamine 1-carboxyvinyltransferase [Desulfomicrobium apsheronum]|uniref:UDP-N-acetylglucosamine 1-carboxyvinyltransferase n=1 Tax=Desulfomicrobium apsheronum TaxID=52560 RepID=A0A1I3VVY4_9BACT|nr:UDP-N-acetylglucosamine 1-carboxyvinyltransferase [Desulfomicrobium apsheronum]SFJ99548.1 UDP-N-acetylglucosamine 1-carboxyvinyltransferase [Desulfomicrobium apsheronum]